MDSYGKSLVSNQMMCIQLPYSNNHSCQLVLWTSQVYHALRSGCIDIAIHTAESNDLSLSGVQSLAADMKGWLSDWQVQGRALPHATETEIEQRALSIIEHRLLDKAGVSVARAVVLVLCVLSASAKPLAAATAGKNALLPGSGVTSIEDWMWLQCSIIHSQLASGTFTSRQEALPSVSFGVL
jgi:hypothetical protein